MPKMRTDIRVSPIFGSFYNVYVVTDVNGVEEEFVMYDCAYARFVYLSDQVAV